MEHLGEWVSKNVFSVTAVISAFVYAWVQQKGNTADIQELKAKQKELDELYKEIIIRFSDQQKELSEALHGIIISIAESEKNQTAALNDLRIQIAGVQINYKEASYG